MRQVITILVSIAFLLLCACGVAENGLADPVSPETAANTGEVTDTETNEPASSADEVSEDRFFKGIEVPDYISDNQLEELIAMDKYLDVTKYLGGNGPKMEYAIDEVEINGILLKLGMSYGDVLATGLAPIEDDFSSTETDSLAHTCNFVDQNGNAIRLGFLGESGKTVADGVLYSVSLEDNLVFEIGPCALPCTISSLIETLDEPYDLGDGYYHDFLDMTMEYRMEDRDVYLTFAVNLETGEIYDFTLEGYVN